MYSLHPLKNHVCKAIDERSIFNSNNGLQDNGSSLYQLLHTWIELYYKTVLMKLTKSVDEPVGVAKCRNCLEKNKCLCHFDD